MNKLSIRGHYFHGAMLAVPAAIFVTTVALTEARAATLAPQTVPDVSQAVGCVLPGQIRRLGADFTYLTPRRPARMPEVYCRARGGEVNESNRGGYTSLR